MKTWNVARAAGVAVFGALLATACGGGGGDSAGSGAISINLTDAPVDSAMEVVVVFTGIELHRTNGESVSIDFSTNRSIDLMKLQGGVTNALTQDAAIPAGEYDWMRLKVLATGNSQSESYIRLLSGLQYPLWIPSGAESGLKLNRPFTVAQGSTTRLLVDFDLRKSVHAPPGQEPNYILRPTLRLLDQIQVGSIEATVNLAALATAQLGASAPIAQCHAGLYLFSGGAATPDDQDGEAADGADPVIYLPVPYDGVATTATVRIPFVEAGTYTLAATCNFDVDAADTNDYNPAAVQGAPGYQTLRWTTAGNVSVSSGGTRTVAIPALP
jgi:hypothetical protein